MKTTTEPGIRRTPPSKQHPKGGYEARVTFKGQRLEKTFARLADARRWRDETLTDLRRGIFHDDRQAALPFRRVASSWLDSIQNKKPKTKAGYEQIVNKHLLPAFGSKQIGSIKPSQIQTFVNSLEASGAKPGTVRNAYRALSPIFKMAVQDGLIRQSPCIGINLPTADHEEMLSLTPEEVAALAVEIDSPHEVLVLFAAYTGLRAGEIGALRVKHLKLLDRKPRVEVFESLADVGGHLHFGRPKTRSSRRSVPLPPFLVELLAAYLRDRPHDPDSLLFTGAQGGPLRHNNFVKRAFKPAVERALPHKAGLRFHDLRHTYAAFLIAQGAHPLAIKQRLGHSSIAVTMDKYGHLFPSLEEKLTEGLEATYASVDGAAESGAALS